MAKSNRTRRVFLFIAAIWAAWIALPSSSAQAQVFLNRSEVIAPSDYPIDALRRGDEGITTFQLRIGRDGRAQKCEILASSGHVPLDDAVCRLMLEKARFDVSVARATHLPPTPFKNLADRDPTGVAPPISG
jgi:TonB family protein